MKQKNIFIGFFIISVTIFGVIIFFHGSGFFDSLQNAVIVLFFFNLAHLIYIYVVKGFLEFLVPRGFFDVIINMSLLIIQLHKLYMWQIGSAILITIFIFFGYGFFLCEEVVNIDVGPKSFFRVYRIFW